MRPATSNPCRLAFATFGFACLCDDRNVVNAFALPHLRQYSLLVSRDPVAIRTVHDAGLSTSLRKRKRRCASSTIQPLFSTTKPIEIVESARSVAATALQKSKKGMGAAQKLESLPAFIHLADQRDRSFARALVATVERREGQIDKVLGLCADTYPPKKGKHAALVQACLRLGAAQLLFLDSPPHAAIKETVDILKMRRPGQKLPPESMVKFVNAVLRRIQREGKDMLKSLTSSRDNIEEWLVKEWEQCWGVENANIIAEMCMVEPYIDLSVKIPAHTSSADALVVLEEMSDLFGDEAAVLPNGSIRVGRDLKGAVSSWPQYNEGKWWVQSAASTLPATGLLNALREGDSNIEDIHVVDMCAAPGGKTAQLLSAGFGIVTAIEANARRSRRLLENLERLQLSDRCDIVVTEGQEWQPSSNHDDDSNIAGILLDVPCSATGTGMRRPDVLRRDSDLGNLPEVQEALLNHCADNILQIGGVLVFSTCSLLKRESEDQVQQLLTRTAGKMVTLPFKKGETGGFDGAIDENGWLRVLPGVLNEPLNSVDGFFVARLQKVA